MAELFLFGEALPLGFSLFGLVLPLVSDDFGDLGVGGAWVGGYRLLLVVLAVEDECWGC